MAVKIRKISKMVANTGIKMLVHGLPGAGKTVLCTTIPAEETCLIISAEAGLLSIQDAPDNIRGAEVETLDDLYDLHEMLLDGADDEDRPFDWVALDSISEIAERVLYNAKKEAKDPRQAYGVMQDEIMDLLRKFRDLPGYNVLMTSKQRRMETDRGMLYVPLLPGQNLHQQIPYLFDEVFALRVEHDEEEGDYRVIQTGRDTAYDAKDRSGKLDMFEPADIAHIAEKIRASKKPKKDPEPKPKQESEETDSGDERDDVVVAESRLYWIHDESDTCGIIKKGEEYAPTTFDNGGAEIVPRDVYLEFKQRIEIGDEPEDAEQLEEAESED